MDDPCTAGAQARRRYPRFQAQVPVELQTAENAAPLRTSTAEISVGGCYIETMFNLAVGTKVSLTLWLNERAVNTSASVATSHPQVGNGFEFSDLTPEDRRALNQFIRALAEQNKP